MQTNNFDFLKDRLPELATLGEFAEQYVFPDPTSSGVKLRLFAEKLVKIIHQDLSLALPDEEGFFHLIRSIEFSNTVPQAIISKLHWLRRNGNKAAHGEKITAEIVLSLLKEAHDLGKWIYVSFFGGDLDKCPNYKEPTKNGKAKEWLREKQLILKKLIKKESEIETLLTQLEGEREKAKAAERSKAELKQLLKRGQKVADALSFDEETTRRLLIDDLLVSAGWKVGANGQNTDEVTQEEEVDHQPTETGKGFADYVLWDESGKPTAVIEAKKTSKDAELGKKQVSLYADGLEKMHGERPVLFYTNGYDIYIWDDVQNEPPRKIYGFYSKDSLQYLHFQRKEKLPGRQLKTNSQIVDRIYQIEAVKRVIERFETKHRKALIVQATGTGKTRVAVALCDALLTGKWVKRILFLCDRRELRKQAKNVFGEFITEPLTVVTARTARDRDKRIYLATYPAMLKCYQTFDVGFFDLIIADESHRSIYNVYRDLFLYFDALQIGLTATPVNFINRNTFRLFDCPDQDPTANYSYEDAITNQPPYLVPFEVYTHTTKFQREGIRYADMTREQQLQLEEQESEPELIEHGAHEIDKQIFNKDSNREILRNLMENGIREQTDSHVGKSIIFARSHKHAMLLRDLFDEMYPQYGGKFCQVIDNYDPRAEQLIDDFKGLGTNDDLTIAISVDMLDTGIDIPEVVNLVFAKPIKSFVKFWQMIGRGTRLCRNLFGAGKDKEKFCIFDHWGNFQWFDFYFKAVEPTQSKSLMQRVFEARVMLAENALNKFNEEAFKLAIDLVAKDVAALEACETVAVKEMWKEIKQVKNPDGLNQFDARTKQVLRSDIAPLMAWRNIRGQSDSYNFDLLISNLQNELLLNSGRFQDFKDDLINRVNQLQRNLSQVRAKSDTIQQVLSNEFWDAVTASTLEQVRTELRGIMQYRQRPDIVKYEPKIIDVLEVKDEIQHHKYKVKTMEGLELAAYRERVERVLTELFEQNETLRKIKLGQPVNDNDLEALISMVLIQHPDIDLKILEQVYPETAGHLDLAIRRVIGLDSEYVNEHFTRFVQNHPELNSDQIKFVNLLKNHICKYGTIKYERLYEAPFTAIHSDGVDGVFENKQVEDLFSVIETINAQS